VFSVFHLQYREYIFRLFMMIGDIKVFSVVAWIFRARTHEMLHQSTSCKSHAL